MRNLKGPPATSEARPTTSEGVWAFFSDNAAMPTVVTGTHCVCGYAVLRHSLFYFLFRMYINECTLSLMLFVLSTCCVLDCGPSPRYSLSSAST